MADDTLVFAFILSGAALLALSVVVRGRLFAGGGGHHLPVDPIDVAALKGGPALAEFAALAALRASGALGANGAPGPLPAGLPRLAQVAHQGMLRGSNPWEALRLPDARAAQAQIRAKLERQGLLTSRGQRAGARILPLVLLCAAAVGIALATRSAADEHTVAFVLGSAVLAIVGVLSLRAPRLTRAGRMILRDQFRRNGHLHPRNRPSWATYGPAGAALSVGLFGTAAWWASDPEYAQYLGLGRAALVSSGGYYTSSSSCGSSSSTSGCSSSSSSDNSSSCSSSSSSSCSSGSSCGSSCGGGGGGD
ncbi:TIGR04222 domain-containing membrane protein [Longispora urticae]